MSRTRDVLIDLTAAVAGVAASWIVGDAILSIAEGKKPLILEPHKFKEHFKGERTAGGFHLAMSLYDTMHISYHGMKTVTSPGKRSYYAGQGLVSVVKWGYHVAWAYRRHFDSYQRERQVREEARTRGPRA
jgi:hypothetical protein